MKHLLVLLAVLALSNCITRVQAPIKPTEALVFCYFKGNGEDGLHLASSRDGYTWTALKRDSSFLRPTVSKDKLMRDPCIVRGADGLFHMVWTVSWQDQGIGYASSKDLVHWSKQEFLPVMAQEPGARNCWAPEITYDATTKTYLIYWATTITGKFPETQSTEEKGYNHRIYSVSTKDFKTYTPTKLLYEPGFNVIDASIQPDGQRYVMFLKDETREPVQKNLRVAFSNQVGGPYGKASAPITGNYWAEGPTAVKLGPDWLVYFDKYREHRYGAVKSSDLRHWTDVSEQIKLPAGLRHGTIFRVSAKELQLLEQQ